MPIIKCAHLKSSSSLRQLLTRAHAQLLFTCLICTKAAFLLTLFYIWRRFGRISSDGHKYEYATILTAYWAKVNKNEYERVKMKLLQGKREREKNTLKVAVNELNRNWEYALCTPFTHCQMQQSGQHAWISNSVNLPYKKQLL